MKRVKPANIRARLYVVAMMLALTSSALVVRAVDMPQWWNLGLPEAIRSKVTIPPHSVAPRGVADRSLYRRMRDAGLVSSL